MIPEHCREVVTQIFYFRVEYSTVSILHLLAVNFLENFDLLLLLVVPCCVVTAAVFTSLLPLCNGVQTLKGKNGQERWLSGCWLHKHENLSSNPRHLFTKLVVCSNVQQNNILLCDQNCLLAFLIPRVDQFPAVARPCPFNSGRVHGEHH